VILFLIPAFLFLFVVVAVLRGLAVNRGFKAIAQNAREEIAERRLRQGTAGAAAKPNKWTWKFTDEQPL
jgi:hypothetical protein